MAMYVEVDAELKAQVMGKHRALIMAGEYDTARSILRFLRDGETTLGLSDTAMIVEDILDKLGCRKKFLRSYYQVRFYLLPETV